MSCSLLVDTTGLADPPSDAAAGDAPPAADGPSGSDASNAGESGTSSYRSVVLEDGPIGYYRLGEPSGSIARDETGGADGAYAASCVLGTEGALGPDSDTAVRFDRCVVVLGQRFDFAARAPFSVEAWVNPSAIDGEYRFVAVKQTFDSQRRGWAMWSHDRSFGFERLRNGDGVYAEAKPLTAGRFTHAVGTYDGSTLRLYVDGTQVADEPDVQSLAAVQEAARIGAYELDGNGGFRGVLDEIAFYDKALSADRIRVHFDAGRR